MQAQSAAAQAKFGVVSGQQPPKEEPVSFKQFASF